jgi:hypothetical protein
MNLYPMLFAEQKQVPQSLPLAGGDVAARTLIVLHGVGTNAFFRFLIQSLDHASNRLLIPLGLSALFL